MPGQDRYIYSRPVRPYHYHRLRRRLIFGLLFILSIAAIVAFLFFDTKRTDKEKPVVSGIQNTVISDNLTTYTTPYFQFKDSGGKWVLEKDRSTGSLFIFDKYFGAEIQGQLVFAVNTEFKDLQRGVSRVLPVRLVNANGFQVTGVSDPCSNQFPPGGPHPIKSLTLNGATFICNGGDNQYTVVASQIGGDYHLPLKTSSGKSVSLEIYYKYNGLEPTQDTFVKVMNNFQTV